VRVEPQVVIVGAGPAGCAAAMTLARAGVSPLLLENGQPGKDKPCGDAWIPAAVDELRSFGVGEREVGATWLKIPRIDGFHSGRKVWSTDFSPSAGVLAPRALVDQALRDRALAEGCSIAYGARAASLELRGDGLRLTIRRGESADIVSPAAVILASGSGCRLARAAELDGEPVLGASISSYLPSDGDLAAPAFLFGEPSPGYAWIFPTGPKSSNAGICALAKSSASELRSQMARLMRRLGAPDGASTRGGLGALWSGHGRNWSDAAGVVACGDAAGLVDPTSGEGLTAALVSGKRAGLAVASFLSGEARALEEYSRWIRDWAETRYAPSLENRMLAGWVGHAPAERRLFALLAGQG
jgi:menaquinone-9 beta-reductase